jgi:hypothetical protein
MAVSHQNPPRSVVTTVTKLTFSQGKPTPMVVQGENTRIIVRVGFLFLENWLQT